MKKLLVALPASVCLELGILCTVQNPFPGSLLIGGALVGAAVSILVFSGK